MPGAVPSELSQLLGARDPAAQEAAWARFVDTYSRLLMHTARSRARDYDAAMDAYAYLLEQLRKEDFRRLRAYAADGRSRFTTWLVVVARRLCLDLYRQRYGRARGFAADEAEARRTRRRLVDLLGEEIEVTRFSGAGGGWGPAAPDPEAQLVAQDLSRALDQALACLESRDRLLLKLRYEDELSAREIAGVMGFPTPFHVYRRLHALLRSLRGELGRRGLEGPRP